MFPRRNFAQKDDSTYLKLRRGLTFSRGSYGDFCSICESLTVHVSRRIFDRRIDLDWFQEDQIELTRSNCQKNDFWVKNRPFLEVF